MHLRILPDHQNQVLKKLFFNLWSGQTRVLMHFQTNRIKALKIYFLMSWAVKNIFDAFLGHQNQVLHKDNFQRLEWLKTCFDAFPGHQNQVLKKNIFQRLEWLKTFFLHFQATRIKSLKKIFFNVWSGWKRVLMHFVTTRIKFKKNYFLTSGVVKNVFWCISRPPESSH
jgi:hypothetical protein